jgi:hypothetical protein
MKGWTNRVNEMNQTFFVRERLVLGGGKVCVLNERHFSPIIQNLHGWR